MPMQRCEFFDGKIYKFHKSWNMCDIYYIYLVLHKLMNYQQGASLRSNI